MKKYQMIEMETVLFSEGDIVTFSSGEQADDLGKWNENWFPQTDKGNE